VSELAGKIAPVIHKALLANGVQLTNKELIPVSEEVAAFVEGLFPKVEKKKEAAIPAATVAPPPPPGGAGA
jgi:hypothetical protein